MPLTPVADKLQLALVASHLVYPQYDPSLLHVGTDQPGGHDLPHEHPPIIGVPYRDQHVRRYQRYL